MVSTCTCRSIFIYGMLMTMSYISAIPQVFADCHNIISQQEGTVLQSRRTKVNLKIDNELNED